MKPWQSMLLSLSVACAVAGGLLARNHAFEVTAPEPTPVNKVEPTNDPGNEEPAPAPKREPVVDTSETTLTSIQTVLPATKKKKARSTAAVTAPKDPTRRALLDLQRAQLDRAMSQ